MKNKHPLDTSNNLCT